MNQANLTELQERKLRTALARLVRVAESGTEIAEALLAQPELSATALGTTVAKIETLRSLSDEEIAPELGLRLKEIARGASAAKGESALSQAEVSLKGSAWRGHCGTTYVVADALIALAAAAKTKIIVLSLGGERSVAISCDMLREVAKNIGKRLGTHAQVTPEGVTFTFGEKGRLRLTHQTTKMVGTVFSVSLEAASQAAPAQEAASQAAPAQEAVSQAAPAQEAASQAASAPADLASAGFRVAGLSPLPSSPFSRPAAL